jgi:hypothetical protein
MNLPEGTNNTSQQTDEDPGNDVETVTPDENVKPVREKNNENRQEEED